MSSHRPAEAFPPGEFLKEELEERGWSQSDFAAITGKDVALISGVINGKRVITVETARAFADALSTSPEYWLTLESSYRLWQASADDRSESMIKRRARLYEYPIREMGRRHWLDDAVSVEILETQLLNFFGRDSLDEIPHIAYAAKKSGPSEGLSPAQLAWMFRVRHLAEAQAVATYSEKKLRDAINEMCHLMQTPQQSERVARLLADAGVRFVVVEALPSLKIDGVCLWLNSKAPVIGMSLRYDRIDNFWFVLRHEMEHVLNNDAKNVPIEEVKPDSDVQESLARDDKGISDQERKANLAAQDFCVPREVIENFIDRVSPYYSGKRIEAFAETINVHPGIVVGQLHNRKELPYTHYRKLLASIRSFVARTAITDGWGSVPQID